MNFEKAYKINQLLGPKTSCQKLLIFLDLQPLMEADGNEFDETQNELLQSNC